MINMKHTPTTTTTTQEPKLSPRQAEAVALYKQKTPVKEIAVKLGIKTVTVYGLLKQAQRKTGLVGRLGHTRPKPTWKKYKPGKDDAKLEIPASIQSYLETLPVAHKAKSKTGSPVHLSCSVTKHEAGTDLYRRVAKANLAINGLGALAKKSGRTFTRREFILEAIEAKLKEVRS